MINVTKMAFESLFFKDELLKSDGIVINKGTGKIVYSLPKDEVDERNLSISDVKASIVLDRLMTKDDIVNSVTKKVTNNSKLNFQKIKRYK